MPALLRATTLLGPRKGSPRTEVAPDRVEEIGATLLRAIEAAIDAGVDPEQALDAALRRRVGGQVAGRAATAVVSPS